MFNALMPGEHDWMKNARMSSSATPGYTPPQDDFASLMVSLGGSPSRAPKPAPAQAPQKKSRPILNALGSYLQFAAPEQYEAGRTARINRDYQNALAGGDMEKAAQYRLQMGDFEGAKQIQDYTTGQAEAARKQEAQGVYQLFTSMQPAQINEYAMQDPAGFERMTGMTSEEYLASAQQMQQVGMTPEQFHQYVIGKAQAELGMEPAGPVEGKVVNNRLVNPITGELLGDYSDPAKPIEVNGVLVDPVTYEPIADYRTPAQTGEMTPYQREQIRMEAARLGISEAQLMLQIQQAEAAASGGANRKTAEDQNGVLRYVDTGEPVFPNVTTAPTTKPLIGAEAMARVTAGLPNAKQAVEDLDRLVFRSKGTAVSAEGYDPASDWGAATIEALPDWGLLKGVARFAGGEDYQLFKDSYGAFEAAMLPIISGAAITESEGLRQMRALEIKPGDSEQTKTRKLAGMRAMVQGVEMAARGDTQGFINMLDRAGSISGAGPVRREEDDAEVDALVQQYLNGAQ